jgi:transposase
MLKLCAKPVASHLLALDNSSTDRPVKDRDKRGLFQPSPLTRQSAPQERAYKTNGSKNVLFNSLIRLMKGWSPSNGLNSKTRWSYSTSQVNLLTFNWEDHGMIYVGMDVDSKQFTIYAINSHKKVVFKGSIEKPSRTKLSAFFKTLANDHKYVVFEAGNQLKWIADTLKKIPDITVHVVHPNEVKWISESSGKTDKIDAKKLAELARADMLPRKVHIVEGETRELREIASARHILQAKRVALINCIRGFCKQEGIRLPEKFFNRDDWRNALGKSKLSKNLKMIIEKMVPAIDALLEAEADLTGEMCQFSDERTELLETIPAIGVITSRVIVGAIDDAKRFDSKKSVAKYGALTPRIYQSGNVIHLGRIAANGRHELRRVLIQCAHTITRMKCLEAKPLREFFERVQKRSGKKKAIVALARKLLTTAFGVLKSGRVYDPKMLEGYKTA